MDGRRDKQSGVAGGGILAVVFATLWGLAALPASAGELALHPTVWEAFEAYRQQPRPGAFAVAEDGRAHGQSQCGRPCDTLAAKRSALSACRTASGGNCVVFAVRDAIAIDYRLLTREELSPCPLSPVPTIRVTLALDDTRFDRGMTVAELGRLFQEDERHWLDEHGSVMGLTEQFFDVDASRIRFIESEGRDGVRCVGYADGEIRLQLGARIYVAREIPDHTCLYHEVLEHEHRHRALGEELTSAFARDLEAQIAAALAEAPQVEIPPGEQPWEVGERRLDEIIAAVRSVFRRDHSRQQLAIDSQSEYARVETACPGETDKYLP